MYLIITAEALDDLYRYAIFSSDDRDEAILAVGDNLEDEEELIVINAAALHRKVHSPAAGYDEQYAVRANIDYPHSHVIGRMRP